MERNKLSYHTVLFERKPKSMELIQLSGLGWLCWLDGGSKGNMGKKVSFLV